MTAAPRLSELSLEKTTPSFPEKTPRKVQDVLVRLRDMLLKNLCLEGGKVYSNVLTPLTKASTPENQTWRYSSGWKVQGASIDSIVDDYINVLASLIYLDSKGHLASREYTELTPHYNFVLGNHVQDQYDSYGVLGETAHADTWTHTAPGHYLAEASLRSSF